MRNTIRTASIPVCLLLTAVGCGSGSGSGVVSCDLRNTPAGSCQDYQADAPILAVYKTQCMDNGGTYSDSTCSHTGALGGCRAMAMSASSSVVTTNWFYSGGPYKTTADVMAGCTGTIFISP